MFGSPKADKKMRESKMKKYQILIIIFLISLSICAFAGMQVKACEWITVTQTANGQITPAGMIAIETGDTLNFTIIPDTGYHIDSITANGEPVTVASPLGESYPFSEISGYDGNLTATFALNTYTIAVTQNANGKITPSTINIDYGGLTAFYINPDSGYYIASITTDAGSVAVTSPSGQTVTFNNVQADHAISATYVQTATPTPAQITPTSTPTALSVSSLSTPTARPSPTTSDNSSGWTLVIVGIAILMAVIAAIVVYKKNPKK